jgi:transformation/transcription domain-associated protein
MSLLAFLLRNPNETLKSFKNVIPEYVVRLLKDCPPELSSARKVRAVSSLAHIFRNY